MTVAALYDIHGNLPALEAVLADIARRGVEQVVVGGDVFPGPMPRECLALLQSLDLPVQWIMGNGDREVVAARQGKGSPSFPAGVQEVMQWVAGVLSNEEADEVARWPASCRVRVDGLGEVLFCHATPQSDTEIFLADTPEAVIAPRFAGLDEGVVVCGHTHMPFDRMVGGTRVVNAGSVGMPFGAPGAYWLELGPGVFPRFLDYDLDRAAARVRATGYPQAEGFAAGNVLAPPSAAMMREALGRSALR